MSYWVVKLLGYWFIGRLREVIVVTAHVLARVVLRASHQSSGKSLHIGARRPSELRVVRYEGQDGFFLLYCDESGKEMTDTWHHTLDEAFDQAEFEFSVQRHEWEQ